MRKTIITTTLGLFMATILFSNVYAITEHQKKLATEGTFAAMQTTKTLREAGEVMQSCTLLLKLGIVTGLEKCVTFIKDIRDSMQGVMDRHENRSISSTVSPSGEEGDIVDNFLADTLMNNR